MNKLVSSIREAILNSGLKDGMTVSFHHHLRNGDWVLNMVMDEIARLGIGNLTLNASSLFDVHAPLKEHIRNGVVTTILTDYMSQELGSFISAGGMKNPVQFRTHGGRPADIENGRTPIDVAFIAAPACDPMGNCTGKIGKSACGSLGYAIPDATIHMIPGWTHNIINLSDTEDLVTVMTCNEIFDPQRPDTFFEKV